MGSALAANLVAAGHPVVAHDAAGPERNVDGATFVADVASVAQQADVVVFSLPDGNVSELVARQLAGADPRRVTHVIDTSTIGLHAAHVVEALFADAGIGYVDAPVSGGVAGARARTLAVMYSGSDEACDRVSPVLAGLSDRTRRVGDRPGLAQAVKLANNFLSATALAATSEAVAFGVAAGVGHGGHARRAQRLERGERGHRRQVPEPRPHRTIRVRLHQLADGQGRRPVPARGPGTGWPDVVRHAHCLRVAGVR